MQYAYAHPRASLVVYHYIVMERLDNMIKGLDPTWWTPQFRGYYCDPDPGSSSFDAQLADALGRRRAGLPVYPEHDHNYLLHCYRLLVEREDWKLKGSRLGDAILDLDLPSPGVVSEMQTVDLR
jgi:uncharacterized protein (TIGR02328 family)